MKSGAAVRVILIVPVPFNIYVKAPRGGKRSIHIENSDVTIAEVQELIDKLEELPSATLKMQPKNKSSLEIGVVINDGNGVHFLSWMNGMELAS